MSDVDTNFGRLPSTANAADRRRGWLAAGGLIGGVLASSCCIVPLVLVTLGLSGAWVGNLTALAPYKPYTAGAALVFIGLGFRQVYFKAKPACDDESFCAQPKSGLIAKTTLWIATLLVVSSVTINWWAPLFY
jgi:mercuric ion transport protein